MTADINKALVVRALSIIDQGLTSGLGVPEPGKLCVEAAICLALGEPHGDNPSCVGPAVRAFKIRLNDANWPSDQTRAEGLREIAIAQLGSNEIDQREFARRVTLKVIQQIVPIALRAATKAVPSHAVALEGCAVACEVAIDLVAARNAALAGQDEARKARAYAADAAYTADAYAYAAAAADAAAYAAAADAAADAAYAAAAADAAYAAADAAAADAAADAAAADAADAAYAAAAAAAADAAYAAAAADAAYAAADAAAADAADAAADAAYAAAYTAAYVDAYADAAKAAARVKILRMAADIGVSALKEMACKGTQWLDLLSEPK